MKILIIGSDRNFQECQTRLGEVHQLEFVNDPKAYNGLWEQIDVVFDFNIHDNPENAKFYKDIKNVFVNTICKSLKEVCVSAGTLKGSWFGFNGLPTFFAQEKLEACVLNSGDEIQLREICDQLRLGYALVKDQVGMVTPRIILMIINEAYYTFEEGTASKKDIDVAMKLGTNYPYGPFEWSERIGIAQIIEVLDALLKETGEERFRACALLRSLA